MRPALTFLLFLQRLLPDQKQDPDHEPCHECPADDQHPHSEPRARAAFRYLVGDGTQREEGSRANAGDSQHVGHLAAHRRPADELGVGVEPQTMREGRRHHQKETRDESIDLGRLLVEADGEEAAPHHRGSDSEVGAVVTDHPPVAFRIHVYTSALRLTVQMHINTFILKKQM